MEKKEQPWSGYPRPQLKREKYSILNGEWKLNGHPIQVPFAPQAKLSNYVGEISEQLAYERTFTVPQDFDKERILLHFGAVDQTASVYVNHRLVGENEGGYLPFSFDITDYVNREGENLLEVLAKDELSSDYPYGKQTKNPDGMWYTEVSGIWQTVWLENVPDTYIERIILKPDLASVEIQVICNKPVKQCEVELFLPEKRSKKAVLVSGKGRIAIEHPINWTPDNPYLYDMKIKAETDEVQSYVALRTIGIASIDGINRVVLNGKPIFLHGVLDQGYFKDGIFLPKEEVEYEQDIKNMKELGYNMLRKHIKIEPECFYYACDKLGMLVMQDMVNSGVYSFVRDTLLPTVGIKVRVEKKLDKHDRRRQIFEKQLRLTIEQLYNHPCIVAYTIFNEGWGQFNSDEMYELAKGLDDTRLYDATSGWFARKKSDFDSEHIYFRLKKLNVKKRPLFVSECGGYKLLVKENFFGKKEYGYGTCKDEADLTARIAKMYEKMIIPGIKKGVCGCVYTQLSDVEGEINGLYTYDRIVCKVDKDVMKGIAGKIEKEINAK